MGCDHNLPPIEVECKEYINPKRKVLIDLSSIVSISLNRFMAKTIDGESLGSFTYDDCPKELKDYIRDNVYPNCNWDEETRKICYDDQAKDR